MVEFVTDQYVNNVVSSCPKPLTEIGEFVFYRTYSRWLEEKGRREYWQETCKRSVNYNLNLEYKHLKKLGMKPDLKRMRKEAEKFFSNQYRTKQFLSGRTLWVGGAENGLADKYPLANFNCAFTNISQWNDLVELFYLLMIGTGVGFKCTKEMALNLKPIRNNFTLISSPYRPLQKNERIEHTEMHILPNGYAKIFVGDSKEGWCEALDKFFCILTEAEFENIHTIKINYNSIRPKGERLKTFGGSASGHSSLKEMFEGFTKVLHNQIDPYLEPLVPDEKGYVRVRPIQILDFGNLIGANVVVGGVRRTAEIFLFDWDDEESLLAKYGINGIWTEQQLEHHFRVGEMLEKRGIKPKWFDDIQNVGDGRFGLDHRRMSNNSVAFNSKPNREDLHLQFMLLQGEGEPCFINLEEANRRRPNCEGLNPCAEILLDSKSTCNLTTVNVMGFVHENPYIENEYYLDIEGLLEAQRLSSRAGVRMTLVELELKGHNGEMGWHEIQQRDRLTGPSLTGWQDAMTLLKMEKEQELHLQSLLHEVAREEADNYSKELRIPSPLLSTTVKPEGTLSQLCNSILKSPVSSGLHASHSPYYIRRIRINSHDPLAKVAIDLGWTVNAEVGTVGDTYEEQIANAKTLVIDFPVQSGATKTKDDLTVEEQFETYFNFQKYYTEHNSSNTITIKAEEGEWEKAEQIVYDNWDDFVGVSFLALDGGTYQLAPYEKISKEQFHELKNRMKEFEPSLLHQYEKIQADRDVGNESCESGACPIV